MRRSREDAALTRRNIVDAAARLFRARGIDAVSVADIMQSLGLTVGGFYRHFESKEALVAEAIESASLQSMSGAVEAEALLASYLSMAHRSNLERGCPVAALCSEVAHQGRVTRKAFSAAVERLVARVESAAPGMDKKRVLVTATELVGALMLARATTDEKLAREILDAASSAISLRVKEAAR
jgi:TetR/AcrR family transcriptional repressor of nem operon